MAIGTEVPPWLNIGPTDYLRAVQAGGSAGLGIAEARNRAREAAARSAAAQQESAARMQESQRAAAQREWEFGERMRQAAEENAMGDAFKREQLAQQGRYQEGLLGYNQGRLGETTAHNMAMEEISAEKAAQMLARGEAQIVEHPEAPGLKFLRNPSGAESVIERPAKDMTDAQKATFALKAFNAFKPLSEGENVEGPMYNARTNYAGGLLRSMGALPRPEFDSSAWSGMNIPELGQPGEGTLGNQDWMSRPLPEVREVIRTTRDGKRAVFDANTKEFLRYAD